MSLVANGKVLNLAPPAAEKRSPASAVGHDAEMHIVDNGAHGGCSDNPPPHTDHLRPLFPPPLPVNGMPGPGGAGMVP